VTKLGGTIRDAEALVGAGSGRETAGGYRIHDFLTYNDSREDVLSRRAVDAGANERVVSPRPKNAGRGADGRYDSAVESGRSRAESESRSTRPVRPVPTRSAVAASTEAPETARGRPPLGVVPGMTERSGVVPIADVLGRLPIRSSGDRS
jgi:hypothetical protein